MANQKKKLQKMPFDDNKTETLGYFLSTIIITVAYSFHNVNAFFF